MSSKLEKRLVRQLSAKGVDGAKDVAHGILLERGHIYPNGDLTIAGMKRDRLGPDGRAKDRASRASGGKHQPEDYTYDRKTNDARLKKR